MKRSVVAMIVSALILAACGGGDAENASTASAKQSKPKSKQSRCKALGKSALAALNGSIAPPKMRSAFVVKSKDEVKPQMGVPPRGFRDGPVYLVAGRAGDRTLLWAVDDGFRTTGGGLAFGADYDTRHGSALGAEVNADTAWGVNEYMDGADDARDCAEKQ